MRTRSMELIWKCGHCGRPIADNPSTWLGSTPYHVECCRAPWITEDDLVREKAREIAVKRIVELEKENADLRHDIARHVKLNTELLNK